jgi:excinuclease ABC subunit A
LPTAKQAECSLLLEQVQRRLGHLTALDLAYLTLDRSAAALSTGELRRVRLTAALASNLVGALYVVDEPTVGLHPRDTAGLLAELARLKDAGNTVLLVEHDPEVIAAADHVIDLGPGAGEEGGRVVYQGPPRGMANAEGPTSDYFSGRSRIALPARRRKARGLLRLSGASTHNLRDLAVEFPLGVLCAVTGVSGAGKSSLVEETLYPALCQAKKKKTSRTTNAKLAGASQVEDVILMDQEPLPRTSRSNPATYLKIFDDIRALFAETSDARIRNFGPGHFSFNQPGGRCETCEGQGTLTVALQFLADVTAPCPECHGKRYTKEVLEIKVRSLSIAEVLELTVREAFRFFRAQPAIERRLKFLLDVGLDYLRLGQAADTLSGGECQRLKLAGHLASSRKPRTLFMLLEPSAGLHLADVARLLECFDRLLEAGHSLLLVEHHLEVIQCADHIIDLGPGAGPAGGRVVAAGTPEEVAQVEESATGLCLRQKMLHDDWKKHPHSKKG